MTSFISTTQMKDYFGLLNQLDQGIIFSSNAIGAVGNYHQRVILFFWGKFIVRTFF